MTAVKTQNKEHTLDAILTNLGDFGKYQIYVFTLVCFAVVLHSAVHIGYVFIAMDVNYRCEIPNKCNPDENEFSPAWIKNAIPFTDNMPSKCYKYMKFPNISLDITNCSAEQFNTAVTERCTTFVYESPEKSILHEYGLQCDENLWKLTMVGTMNNIGQFFGLFISGIVSDKYGRKLVLVWGMVLCAVCGVARTFMPTYEWFMVFEFLDAAFGSGTYICGFVLGMELVAPKNRVLTGTISSCCYAFGEIFTAGSAWLVKDWRKLIYIIYSPIFLLISYIWIIPESTRWNLSKGRIEEAKKTLKTLARINGKKLDDDQLDKLSIVECEESQKSKSPFTDAFKSSTLMLRLIACCFCWVSCTFLFYGLTLNSVALAGNSYLDFILTALVEIPAYIACNYMIENLGRKKSLCFSYLLTGAACLSFIFIPNDSHWGSMSVYLVGKFGSTAAFTVLYVLTSEMFPTTMRHSFMGICSTFGRCGSMVSPQAPLLAQLWAPLPLMIFAAMAGLAGLLTLVFPETLNQKLPDTIQEAENIGKILQTEQNEKDRF